MMVFIPTHDIHKGMGQVRLIQLKKLVKVSTKTKVSQLLLSFDYPYNMLLKIVPDS